MFSGILKISSYYFNPYAIPVFVAGLLILSIGLFVLSQNRKSVINVAFFAQCFSVSFWFLMISIVYSSRNQDTAIFWYKYFTFFGVVNIMPSVYLFAVSWAGEFKRKRPFVIFNYLVSFIFYLITVTTDKVIPSDNMHRYFWGLYPVYKPAASIFLVFFAVQFFISLRKLSLVYKREQVAVKRRQVQIVTIATLIAFVASADFVPKFYDFPLYPFGYIPMLAYIIIVAYSIIKYRTFDIETVLHKTAVWLLSFSLIVIPILFAYRWVHPYASASLSFGILFWLVSFALLVFYLRAVQPQIDHFFQRRKTDLEEIAGKFSDDLVHLKGISRLIQRIQDTIADALYCEFVDVFIYNEADNNYKLANIAQGEGKITEFRADDEFLSWLLKYNKIIHLEFLEIDPAYASIKEKAKDYFNLSKALIIIPLLLNEKPLGIIHLGRKANLKRYGASDFYFLNALKSQATIAISNSLLYENMEGQVRERTKELVEMQRQLVQAEKLATVGTLAGGVAHEINNPLTAILTNVQMLLALENSLEADSKESLELIEEATKRCRTIVQKLMVYAKKPLEQAEMSKINLFKAVENVVSFLGYQLEQENIKVITKAKKNTYMVIGNQNELEQVLTNIILNAKDAIKKVKKSGNIHIGLSETDDYIKIEIKDEGSGIPKEVMPKIFDPFFTTKDVGKGVGLGLSICQSIVEKHKGFISVQSLVNEGSTFSVQLPKVKELAFA